MARLDCLSSLHRWTTALLVVVWLLFSARSLFAQDSPSAATSKPAQPPSENGFPVKNALVVSKCGACHASDAKGNMSRMAITRSCVSCHALAKPLSWRRSPEDWKLLVNTHIAFFPWVDSLNFQRPPQRPGDPPPPPGTDTRAPVEQALAYLAQAGSLHSAEWADWHARMRSPKLDGRWLVSGTQPGKGKFFGTVEIAAMPSGEGFTTKTKLTFPADNSTVSESGKAIVYTGYAWRGRSTSDKPGSTPNDLSTTREVMMLSKDQSQLEGRWFWGAYQEFGMDLAMRRALDAPTVLGIDKFALKAGSSASEVQIYGDRLPGNLSPSDIDLGVGVSVKKVVTSTPTLVKIIADVAPTAVPGNNLRPLPMPMAQTASPTPLTTSNSVL